MYAIEAALALIQAAGGGRLGLQVRKGRPAGLTAIIEVTPSPGGPVLPWLATLVGIVSQDNGYGAVEAMFDATGTVISAQVTLSVKCNRIDDLRGRLDHVAGLGVRPAGAGTRGAARTVTMGL